MDEVNVSSKSQKQWVTLMIISTAYLAVFINIQGFIAMLPLVQEDFFISRAEIGLYSSFYFISAIFMAVFSGKIVDQLGTKKGLFIGASITGVMMILHAFSPFFWVILVLAFFTGLAFSVITPSVNKSVIEISEPSKRSVSMGIVHGGGGVGGVLGAILLPFIGEMIGWRTTMFMSGLLAVIIGGFILLFFRPTIIQATDEQEAPANKRSLKEDVILFIKDRYLLVICSMGFVFGVGISSAIGHYAMFLTSDLGYTVTFAGLCLGILHAGGILGHPSWGVVNEKVFKGDRRIGLFCNGLIVAGFCLFYGLVVSQILLPEPLIMALSFGLGFCTIGVLSIYFTAIGELAPRENVGVVTGIAMIFPRSGMVVGPPIFGFIADSSGTYVLSWLFLGIIVLFLSLAFLYASGVYGRKVKESVSKT